METRDLDSADVDKCETRRDETEAGLVTFAKPTPTTGTATKPAAAACCKPSSDLRLQTQHTHTNPFNGPLSRTNRVSRYQKGKTNLDFTEARDNEWQ